MDIGIPDLSTGRDSAPDATRRRGKADPSDFSALLDRSVDEPDAQPRERAADKSSAAGAADKSREKARHTDRADNEETHRAEDDRSTRAADDAAAAPNPAQQPQETQPPGQPRHAGEEPQAPVQAADTKPATDAAPSEKLAEEAELLAQQSPPVAPLNTAANAAPAQAPADVSPAPVAPKDAEALPAPAVASDDAVKATPEQGTKTAAPAASPATPFAEQLAASAANPPEPATAKSKPKAETAPATDAPTKAPAATAPAAVVGPAEPVVAPNQQLGSAQGNTEQPTAADAPAAQPTAPAQPAAQAPAMPTPTAAPTPAGGTDTADDTSVIAVLRAAGAQDQSAPRAESEPDDAPAPADDFLKTVQIDAKPVADPQKSEPPARPFGALAPGLGVAAQITAQQTPEQANAAERLAQLASAAEDKAVDALAKPADDAKPADTATSAIRAEQQPQFDAPAQRQTAVDTSPASAAARMARPATHPVVTQVAAQVAQAAADGTDRINIRLSPAELGRIDVKLDFGPDGRVQAVFAAERPQTMELLQRDARDLERALQDAGLRADSGSLSFNLRGQGRDAQNGQTSHGGARNSAPPEVAASQLQVYSAGHAGSGRLDIRI